MEAGDGVEEAVGEGGEGDFDFRISSSSRMSRKKSFLFNNGSCGSTFKYW